MKSLELSMSQSSTSRSTASPAGPSKRTKRKVSAHAGASVLLTHLDWCLAPPHVSFACGSLEALPSSFVSIASRFRPACSVTSTTLYVLWSCGSQASVFDGRSL